jgi:chemotaxis signal transduction protein
VSGVHVLVRVGQESYAVPVENVREVATLGDVAPLPGAGSIVLGVQNLHGQILPVFDTAALFGLPSSPAARVLVAEHSGRSAGFAVDSVVEVTELGDPTEQRESELLVGSLLVDGELVGVLDVPRVFAALEERAAR